MGKALTKASQPPQELNGSCLDQRNPRPMLVVISGTSLGSVYQIDARSTTIGRDDACDICLRDEGISREHARLELDDEHGVTLRDLNSTNGTFVNGVRLPCHPLRDGETVQIGPSAVMKYGVEDTVEDALALMDYESAIRDSLTGTYNKRHFLWSLRNECAIAARHDSVFSLILFEIAQYPEVQSTLGEEAAQSLLRRVAEVAGRSLREGDLFARYGEAQFATIFRNQSKKIVAASAKRLRRSVEACSFEWECQRFPLSISLGVSTCESAVFSDPQELLSEASFRPQALLAIDDAPHQGPDRLRSCTA